MFNAGSVKGEWGRRGSEFGGGRRMDSLEWGEGGIWRREGVFEVGRGSLKWGGGFGGGGAGGHLSNGVL